MLTCLASLVLAQTIQTYSVDLKAEMPISPYIYGVNHPEWERLGFRPTLARQGGNRMTAYNWETNASNAGNDWHHQNDGYLGKTNEPGWTARTFLEAAQKHGAAAIVTVPTNGYVSADKNEDGDVNKTPDWLNVRFHRSYANKPGRKYVYPPDIQDKAVYQDEFVAWIMKRASAKTPVWFSLDNEPDLWHSTHARITPKKPGFADIIANNIEFATAIKRVAPKATVVGPANYGWQGFRTFQDAPDANGRDFLNSYLAQMRIAGQRAKMRLLDVLDIHWYPEARGGGVRIAMSNQKENEETYEARIQAPRSLWDAKYVEDSWITTDSIKGQPIRLIPRIQSQIKAHYPGTKLGILEYNYGGGSHVSGLLAQADVLGIFGRYGVYAACNWGVGPRDRAHASAFRAFLDFDGKGSAFGPVGLGVSGGDPALSSLYASKRGSRVVLVALNKSKEPLSFFVKMPKYKVLKAVVRTEDALNGKPLPTSSPRGLNFSLPGRSVATLEVE